MSAKIVGHVWLVTEYKTGIVGPRETPHLFGIFTSEKAARDEYGEEVAGYKAVFEKMPLWGPE